MQDIPTTAQLQSGIKRINDRITQLERKGLKGSQSYQDYIDLSIKLGGQGIKHSKTGYASLDIPRINKMSDTQKLLIEKWGRVGSTKTAGGEIKKARQQYKKENPDQEPTQTELIEIVETNKEIHEFIEKNSNLIYKVEHLTEAVRRPWGMPLTRDEAKDLLTMKTNPKYLNESGEFVGDNAQNTEKGASEVQNASGGKSKR